MDLFYSIMFEFPMRTCLPNTRMWSKPREVMSAPRMQKWAMERWYSPLGDDVDGRRGSARILSCMPDLSLRGQRPLQSDTMQFDDNLVTRMPQFTCTARCWR